MVLCETWLTDSYQLDDVIVNELLPEGYLIERADRKSGQTGSGLAIVYRENLTFQLTEKCHLHSSNVYTGYSISTTLQLIYVVSIDLHHLNEMVSHQNL